MKTTVIAVLLFASCVTSPDMPRPDESLPRPDGGQLMVSNPGQAGDNKDGSRIKLRFVVTELEDGTKFTNPLPSYFDIKLNAACTFQKTSDGVTRCIPYGQIGAVVIYGLFADAACTVRVIPTAVAPCPGVTPPTYVGAYETDAPGDQCQVQKYVIYDIGPEIDRRAIYKIAGAMCVLATAAELNPYPANTYKFISLAKKTDLTQFVAVK